MTQLQQALNMAGVFAVLRPGVIEQARREMAVDFAVRRRRAIRELVEAGFGATRLSLADLEYAVRVLSARRTSKRRGDRLVLPGMNGWAVAGRRKAA